MKYFEYLFDYQVDARTTTRELGNMAYQVGDNKDDVINNRSILIKDIGVEKDHLVFVHQTHSDVIKEVTSNDLGKGMDDFESGVEADALYTKERGIALGIFHADCEPVFFYDKTVPLVGIIHAGHQGTLKHVVFKSLSKVIATEHLNPRNIKVWVGPLRRKTTYKIEPGKEMEIITSACPFDGTNFDVAFSNKMDMICLGIPEENIKDINIDTAFDNNCFSAYKKTPVGRMASIILLK